MSTKLFPTDAILQPHIRSIDIHHHYFPSDLKKEEPDANLAWKTPPENLPWSPEKSLQIMDETEVDFAIISFPALSTGNVCEENRAAARRHNQFAANVCLANPSRFGFFATLPFLDDVEGCLEEIAYCLDHLHANGVALASSYGQGAATAYVGSDEYDPVWRELNDRQAVVFLHGSQVPPSAPCPHPFLGVPITEVPHETFKAAAHLVVTGHRRRFPGVKIILAHLGGPTPFLAPRVAVLSHHMGCPLNAEEIMEDFKTFYYETALSAYDANLVAMETFVQPDHILFGTDYPAVNKEMIDWFTSNLRRYYSHNELSLSHIMGENALKLFSTQHVNIE